jgi:NADPH:quinone reductase-like Zn-dependent oxidoreductase
MKAVVIDGFGGVEQLHIQDVDDPPVGRGEVLVRVRATSVNPVDLKIRNGSAARRMGVELPAILGRDLAGEVVRSGEGVTGFDKGMRVGSVGRSAVFVAQQHGGRVIAGVRASQVDDAKLLGVDQVISTDDEKQLDQLHDLDAIADTVGGATAARALKAIREGGVFGTVLAPPEAAQDNVRLATMMAVPDASRLYELVDEVARGDLKIPIAKTIPLDQVQEAHREAENHPHGKIVLKTA